MESDGCSHFACAMRVSTLKRRFFRGFGFGIPRTCCLLASCRLVSVKFEPLLEAGVLLSAALPLAAFVGFVVVIGLQGIYVSRARTTNLWKWR
jgi:hypothetical protein